MGGKGLNQEEGWDQGGEKLPECGGGEVRCLALLPVQVT